MRADRGKRESRDWTTEVAGRGAGDENFPNGVVEASPKDNRWRRHAADVAKCMIAKGRRGSGGCWRFDESGIWCGIGSAYRGPNGLRRGMRRRRYLRRGGKKKAGRSMCRPSVDWSVEALQNWTDIIFPRAAGVWRQALARYIRCE